MKRLCFAGLLFAFALSASAEEPALRIGAILPLTGDSATYGQGVQNAILMALDTLPPDLRAQMKVTFEDDGLKPTQAVSAFQKLASKDQINLVINLSSGTGKALAPVAEQRKVPFISISSDARISAGSNCTVNFWITPEAEAKAMVPEVLRRGYRRIARASTSQGGAYALDRAFDREAAGRITIIYEDEFPLETRDFRSFLTRLRTKGDFDAVLLSLLPGQLSAFAKQFRQAGFTQPLFGFELFEDANEVKASEDTLVGQWYVNAADASERFMTEYDKRFPGASHWAASNGYDAILLLAEALKQGKTGPALCQYLRTVKDFSKGAMGTYSASGDNRFTLPVAIKEVTATGFKTLHNAQQPSGQ